MEEFKFLKSIIEIAWKNTFMRTQLNFIFHLDFCLIFPKVFPKTLRASRTISSSIAAAILMAEN